MRAAPHGAATWSAIVGSVAHAFTRPSFAIFADLMAGWVLTPGRRTITRIISVIDPGHLRAHDAYHRFLRDGVWDMGELWRILAVAIVERLVAPDTQVCLDLDDTSTTRPVAGSRGPGSSVMRCVRPATAPSMRLA